VTDEDPNELAPSLFADVLAEDDRPRRAVRDRWRACHLRGVAWRAQKPLGSGHFAEAADGTRTHDLLHGKQKLIRRLTPLLPANCRFPPPTGPEPDTPRSGWIPGVLRTISESGSDGWAVCLLCRRSTVRPLDEKDLPADRDLAQGRRDDRTVTRQAAVRYAACSSSSSCSAAPTPGPGSPPTPRPGSGTAPASPTPRCTARCS
jgi:hypothetical protein